MGKNSINRELRPIEGGVCAPEGYKANAVACGIKENGDLDFAMILSEKRCAVGCVYAQGHTIGGPPKVSKKNMRLGYARAMLVNSGIANCVGENSEKFALSVCDLFFSHGLERTEIVIASTGEIGKKLELEPFKKGVKPLLDGLAASHENSLKAATAIMTEDSQVKQLSFSFDLGDYPCKIGAIFKGGLQTSPNMATFLAFLTTDVNISTPMLQKALEAETRETLNQLNLDGVSSPNDTVCIFANGRAGNYKIDCADTEYQKFTFALRSVLTEICRITAKDGAKKVLTCRVKGAKSKQVARSISKALVGASGVKDCLMKGEIDIEYLFYTVFENAEHIKADKLQIILSSERGEFVVYEDASKIVPEKEVIGNILSADEVKMEINLFNGNYSSLAFGRI